jgi:hypothetical protein
VPVEFQLIRTNITGSVSLAAGSLPPGITATFSPLSASGESTLLLTAASDLVPVLATIEVTATAEGLAAHATVTVNAKARGQIFPSYQVVEVIYAAPGMSGGKSSSEVVYGSQSTAGTTLSASDSFKEGLSVTATLGVSAGPVSLGASGQYTASQTATDTSSVNVSKSTSTQITVPGPDQDGILHGNDLIVVCTNPSMTVTIDYQDNVTWELGVNGQDMLTQFLYVDWLNHPSDMPAGVVSVLEAANITPADYPQIAELDPFYSVTSPTANGTIDPNRFILTPFSVPYEPPEAPGDPVPTMTYTQTNATTTTDTEQVQLQYGVTCTVSAGLQGPLSAVVKAAGTFEFTNTSTEVTSTASTQSASVTVGGPSSAWQGPTNILVYWDTLFSSFMFAFATESPAVSGTITDSAGPAVGEVVTLAIGGITLTTFTGAGGQYSFYNATPGQGVISAGGQDATVTIPVESAVRPVVNLTL